MNKIESKFNESCPHSCGGEPLCFGWQYAKFFVVPTHVGVNRAIDNYYAGLPSCPHSCGGEPRVSASLMGFITVVPTHVGVNRYP